MSRPIIDDIVDRNRERNLSTYFTAKELPRYFGEVEDARESIKLDSVRGAKKTGNSLIENIKIGVEAMQLEGSNGIIRELVNGIPKDKHVHPDIIKLAKVCIVGSYSQNEDYTEVISEFAKNILIMADNINIPIPLPKNNKLQKLLSEELNEYLLDFLQKRDIPYFEIVDNVKTTVIKSKKNKLLEAANAADVKGK